MSSGNKVKLKSPDGEIFEVDELVAYELQTLKTIMEDIGANITIPLPNVSSEILSKVIEYCKYHVESQNEPPDPEHKIKQWDAEFMKVDPATVKALLVTADWLKIENLLELTSQTIADIIKANCDSPPKLRRILGIKNTFTREEKEETRRISNLFSTPTRTSGGKRKRK